MISLRYRYVGHEVLPPNMGQQAVEVLCTLDPRHISALRESRFDDAAKLSVAAQILLLQLTGGQSTQPNTVPANLVKFLATQILQYEPKIVTLAAVQRFEERTLRIHRMWARERLEFALQTKESLDELDLLATRLSAESPSQDALRESLSHWLFDRRIVNPGPRAIADLARKHFLEVEKAILAAIRKSVPSPAVRQILVELFEPCPYAVNSNYIDWLRTRVGRAGPSRLTEASTRVAYLRALRVDQWDLGEISSSRLKAYAMQVQLRAPSETRRRIESTQIIELVCFLRYTLNALTDEVIYRMDRQAAKVSGSGAGNFTARRVADASFYRQHAEAAKAMATDTSKPLAERMAGVIAELEMMLADDDTTEASVIRETLVEENTRVKVVIAPLEYLEIVGKDGTKEKNLLDSLRRLQKSKLDELPADFDVSGVPPSWLEDVNGEDRRRARKAFEACAMEGIRKALKGGKLWIPHSVEYRSWAEMLIPVEDWKRNRERLCESYGLPIDGQEFLKAQRQRLGDGLTAVAEALGKGLLEIDPDGSVRLPAISPADIHPEQAKTDRGMAAARGVVQLPEILLSIDKETGFSRILLEHRAADADELVRLYGGVLAYGMLLDAKQVAAMIPGMAETDISAAMRLLERSDRLAIANGRIVDFQQRFEIVKSWGDGTGASSDMMALDASFHLYFARLNPRRKTMGTGIYTTVLDSYPVVAYQHIVQNTWQAAAAVEGAQKYNATSKEDRVRLELVAVDTHGFTYPGMALAKLLRFELCPHLSHLPDRKLFVFRRDMEVPEELDAIVQAELSERAILKAWDELLRVAASVQSGRVTAAWAITRLGSAARGGPIFAAFEQLGKLLRTIFLCDYFRNPDFRREIRTLLNRGESVHTLQRAISAGRLPPSRARRKEEADAVAGSHTLLTNIVLAFNTMRLNEHVARLRKAGQPIEPETLRHVGPGQFASINFRGVLSFESVAAFAGHLLAPEKTAARKAR